jgi:hypothetical protein
MNPKSNYPNEFNLASALGCGVCAMEDGLTKVSPALNYDGPAAGPR